MKGKKLAVLVVAIVLVIGIITGLVLANRDRSIGSVNGLPVYEEELKVYMNRNRAAVGAKLAGELGIESFGEDFWTTDYDGVNPEQELRKKAMESLVRDKTVQYMAVTRGITAPGDFGSLKAALKQNGEEPAGHSFGPKEYQVSEYLAYQMTNTEDELKTFLLNKELFPTEGELEQAFDSLPEEVKRTHFTTSGFVGQKNENKEEVSQQNMPFGTSEEYSGYSWESFIMNSQEIHREDIYALGLMELLYATQQGEVATYDDKVYFIESKTGGQSLEYQQAAELGRNKWINDKFDQMLEEEIKKADVVLK